MRSRRLRPHVQDHSPLVCCAGLVRARPRVPPALPNSVGPPVCRPRGHPPRSRDPEQPDPLQRIAELSALLKKLGPEAVPALTEALRQRAARRRRPGADRARPPGGPAFDPKAAFAWTSSDWRAGYGTVIAAVFRAGRTSTRKKRSRMRGALRFPGQLEMAKDALYAGWDESGKPGLQEVFDQLAMRDQQRLAQILARRRVITLGFEERSMGASRSRIPRAADGRPARRERGGRHESRRAARGRVGDAADRRGEGADRLPAPDRNALGQHDPLASDGVALVAPGGHRSRRRRRRIVSRLADEGFPAGGAWIRGDGSKPRDRAWSEPAIAIFGKTNGLARPQESLEPLGAVQGSRSFATDDSVSAASIG